MGTTPHETQRHYTDSTTIVTNKEAAFKGCPFVGLAAFRIDQAHLFFGRQKETLNALACFDTRRGAATVSKCSEGTFRVSATTVFATPRQPYPKGRYLSQIQGRTYANVFGLVERFINAKVLEVSRDHWLGDQVVLEALVRFCDEELKHQELFRRVEHLAAEKMPPGYSFVPDPMMSPGPSSARVRGPCSPSSCTSSC